jgi:hypothetical protein
LCEISGTNLAKIRSNKADRHAEDGAIFWKRLKIRTLWMSNFKMRFKIPLLSLS